MSMLAAVENSVVRSGLSFICTLQTADIALQIGYIPVAAAVLVLRQPGVTHKCGTVLLTDQIARALTPTMWGPDGNSSAYARYASQPEWQRVMLSRIQPQPE